MSWVFGLSQQLATVICCGWFQSSGNRGFNSTVDGAVESVLKLEVEGLSPKDTSFLPNHIAREE